MKKYLACIFLFFILLSNADMASGDQEDWWSDKFNYRVKVVSLNDSDYGAVDMDFDQISSMLGIYPFNPDYGFFELIDPMSLRLVEQDGTPSLHKFQWEPLYYELVDDFEDGKDNWKISTQMETLLNNNGSGQELYFYKSTDSGIKLYTSVSSDAFKNMDYLSFFGSGYFRITLKDPGKGNYVFDEVFESSQFRQHVIPLSFADYREGVDYYLEIFPLDIVSFNVIDDIMFIGDSVRIEYAPSDNDLYVYFNTYVTGTEIDYYEMERFSADFVTTSLSAPEGFRVDVEYAPDGVVSGTQEIKATVMDPRHEIEWVRYRVDWPSWVEFGSEEYGVWGDLELINGQWSATWDTKDTICDGHHSLTIMAKDVMGAVAFQIVDVEVRNIEGDVNLAPGIDSFSFAVVGDTQPKTGSDPNPLVATYIMEKIAENENVDFIIQVGDLNYAGHKPEFEQVRKQITAYAKVPFYATVGNHDAAASEGLENFEYYFGHIMYSFDYGNSHFIFLCTELDDQKGYITGDQLLWLRDELEANKGMEHVFIMAHQPIYPIYYGIINQMAVQGAIENYDNVTAIFQGHEHTYFHEMIDGMHNFITGGATWLDPQYDRENTFNHYFVIDIDGAEMSWRAEKTSHLFLDTPTDQYHTPSDSVEVIGNTQPYTTVLINNIEAMSDYTGEYKATVPLDFGNNVITVTTSELPDNMEHSVYINVFREVPLEMDVPESIAEGEQLKVVITSQGAPVEGANVMILGESKLTDSIGTAMFDSYPEDQFKVTVSGEGYIDTYDTVSIDSKDGDGVIMYALIVLVGIGVIIAFLRKK